MKIALVCTGLGNVWRGYERFTHEIFHLLKDDLDITLFKGGGDRKEREVIIPNLKRDGLLSNFRFLEKTPRNPYYFEVLTFLVGLLPQLMKGRYDIVHFTDCPLANHFYHLRTKLGFKFNFKTLFTNGNPITDSCLDRVDYLQQLTPWQVEAMVHFGISENKMFEIPFGVHCSDFRKNSGKSAKLRTRYGIPQNKKVILAVSALNKAHKRIDYLIEETARLGDEYFLFVAGHMEDKTLVPMARQLLKDNFRFVHVPFHEANEIYNLGDFFVMGSLIEGFGLAIVEAMSAGIPVIAHNSTHYQWIATDQRSLTDMSIRGNLSRKITELAQHKILSEEIAKNNYESTISRFNWPNLKGRYIKMYKTVFEGKTSRFADKKALTHV